jgi:hypothetical protein
MWVLHETAVLLEKEDLAEISELKAWSKGCDLPQT